MTTPTDPAGAFDDEIAAVMRMARVVFAAVTSSAAHVDDALTLVQLRALVLVATSPTQVTTSAVADTMDVHLSTASRLCDRLVSAGWLRRDESPQDRRHLILSLTAEGNAVLSQVMAHRRQRFAAILEQMTPTDRALMRAGFDRFADAAGEKPSDFDHPSVKAVEDTRTTDARHRGQ